MTKAFVLAAGQGKRFLPFSEKTPKPLFKIGKISLIEKNLNNLKKCGVDEVVINLFHLGEKIIDTIGEWKDKKETYKLIENSHEKYKNNFYLVEKFFYFPHAGDQSSVCERRSCFSGSPSSPSVGLDGEEEK